MKIPTFTLDKVKNQQIILLVGIVCTLSLIIFVVVCLFVTQTDRTAKPKKSYKSSISTATSRISPQESWMENMKLENELQRKRLVALETSLNKVLKMNEERIEVEEKNQVEPVTHNAVMELKNDIQQTILPPAPQELPMAPGVPISNAQMTTMVVPFRSNGINKLNINLTNSRRNKPLKTVDNYIPAGSFAPAIVLEGVDASTSVHAQGDPRPLTVQVTEDAYLPSNHRSRLKGCFITAAAAGDLSSERAYIRLEKLSCVEKKTGEVIEINVKGHLVGTDSKSGQRGRLVDKTGPMMRNAAVGGFLSGAADFLSQNRNPIKFLPSGIAESNPTPTGDLLGQGLAKGAGSALEKFGEYYIKRAEQMQPIIEVRPGMEVAVLFTEGFSLSESMTRSAISKANDQHRYQQINELGDSEKSVDSWNSNGDQK